MAMTVRIAGLAAASEQVRLAAMVGAQKGLLVAGARAEALVKENITHSFLGRPPAVATGNLANSIAFSISKEASLSRAVVVAGAPADVYADYVESGTGPHFPPPSALLLWVEKKFHPANEKEALRIAFAVARNISKRGVSAFGMFARAFAVIEQELRGIFQVQIAEALAAAGVLKK